MFAFIWMILSGLIIGVIAKLIHPGKENMGWFLTILLGIGGSVLGGWLSTSILGMSPGAIMSFVWAVVGAILILVLFGLITKK